MENEMQFAQIEKSILVIRNQQVMLDRDLAELYGVETKRINEQVKRNAERFPKDFMFQLTKEEFMSVKSQIATSRNNIFAGQDGGTRKLPYAFTEQGVAMLSSVLKSKNAIAVHIQIMRAFVSMRRFLSRNVHLFDELADIKQHQIDSDKRIDELFTIMDKYKIEEKQGIFFQGQIFDAYAKFEHFIRAAKKEITLIDGYIDLTVLERLTQKGSGVQVTIYTAPTAAVTAQDIQKFNAQYPTLTVRQTQKMHDRFLIIDGKTLYHIGASLKDLGKKCFAFEVLDPALIPSIMEHL